MGRRLYGLTVAAVAALSIFAGCSGGSKSLAPVQSQAALGSKVGVTFTLSIPLTATNSSSQRTPKYVPTSTQSIVIEYIGDNPSATPAPASSPPSTATVAATINVATSGTNPPPAGSCYNNSGSYVCTITVQLPVGVLDFYVVAYDGQNGTGNVVASTISIVQVAQNGSLTQPGTSTAVSIVLGASPASGSTTLDAIAAIVPNGLPNPATTPASYPSNAPPFVYSAAGALSYGGLSPNTPLSGVVVTDSDTSGGSCLVYIKVGSTTATPCPFATAASSVVMTNTSDTYAILYNGKFVPAGTINISATGAASPMPVSITPTAISAGNLTFPSGGGITSGIVWDATSKNVYVTSGDPAKPLYRVPYSTTTGYGTPQAVAVANLNGNSATQLTGVNTGGNGATIGGANGVVIGSDGNIWFTEHNGRSTTQYVGVYVVNAPAINPATGATVQPGSGIFLEYTLLENDSIPTKGIASMGGYIWVISDYGDLWRINPASGVVNPNLGTAYSPGTVPSGANTAQQMTHSDGTTPWKSTSGLYYTSNMVALNGKLWVTSWAAGELAQISVDTASSPSAGLCTPSGPPACIGSYVASSSGLSDPCGTTTDGTNIYVANCSSYALNQFTQGLSTTTAAQAFQNVYGGLVQTGDGWFWTLASTGASAVEGMTSATSGPVTASNAACNTTGDLIHANGLIVGPDGTLLIAPMTQGGGSGLSVICGVVY